MGLGSSVEALPKCNIKTSSELVESQQRQQQLDQQKCSLEAKPSDLLHSVGTMTNGTLFQPQYTEVFSSDMATSTVPMGSGFVEYNTAHSNNWQSMDAPVGFPSHRQSRSRHRHLIDSRLNNSFADGEAMVNAADACISDIRRVEENLRMESRMLSENNNIPMARCSTPSPAYCFHCDHDHRERCCLYVGDTPEDGPYYSRWKRDLENPTVRPQYIPKIPEAVSGNSTPFWFPAYTYTKPEAIKQKMLEKNPPPPAVWMRQYYYPIVGYGHEYQLMNQATQERPTPYQQYLQQHQQDLYRLYHHQQQQQQHQQVHSRDTAACRHGRKCEGCPATLGISGNPYAQQQFHPQPNSQVAGDYMQQMHHPSAYYYHGSYYSGHQQHQHLPQQHYVTPMGYAPVPVYHDGYLHPGYPLGYQPVTAIPPREPTPPSPTPTTSTPLWLLFCQKLSRKFPDRSKKPSPTKGRSPNKNYVHHHIRHNPTTVAPTAATSFTPSIAPDYYPPKYASIDHHPHVQYQSMVQPVPNYGRPVAVGQTVVPHPPYYSHVPPPAATPMNEVGMYYVTPATVNI